MFGTSLITRPLKIATRGAELTLHGARDAVDLAEALVGLVAKRVIGHNGHGPAGHDTNGHGPAAEPAAWQGPAASSTSSPQDSESPAATTTAPPRPVTTAPEPPEPPEPLEPLVPEPTETVEAEVVDEGPLAPLDPAAGHVTEEAEVVDEVSDPGAEDGAGAQLRVDEPWQGYRQMKAKEIIDRLASSSVEELAAVELFELAGRNRKSVVAAARRALKQASPPR